MEGVQDKMRVICDIDEVVVFYIQIVPICIQLSAIRILFIYIYLFCNYLAPVFITIIHCCISVLYNYQFTPHEKIGYPVCMHWFI